MTTSHPSDERLGAWMDDRLSPAERREVERHLESCDQCRRLREALLAARNRLRTEVESPPIPAGFESRILAALDAEDARQGEPQGFFAAEAAGPSTMTAEEAPPEAALAEVLPEPPGVLEEVPEEALPFPKPRRWRTLIPLATAAAGLLALVWLWGGRGGPSPPGSPPETTAGFLPALIAGYEALSGPQLPQALQAGSAQEVEARWQQQGIRFPARVFDLEGMGIRVAGGDASPLGSQLAARSIYRGQDETYVCWMLAEAPRGLPPPAERRVENGIEFLVYQKEGKTLVLWQEGDVFCAFVGDDDPETVISLAIAKAMLAIPAEEA